MLRGFLSTRSHSILIGVGVLAALLLPFIVTQAINNALSLKTAHALMGYLAQSTKAPDPFFFVGRGLDDNHSIDMLAAIHRAFLDWRIPHADSLRTKNALVIAHAIHSTVDMENWLTKSQIKESDLNQFSLLAIANHQYQLGVFWSAARWYAAWLDRLPQKFLFARERSLSAFVKGGKQYFELRNISEAERFFRQALTIQYNDLQSQYWLERCLNDHRQIQSVKELRSELRYFTIPRVIDSSEDWPRIALDLYDRQVWAEKQVYGLTSLLKWHGQRDAAQRIVDTMLSRSAKHALWLELKLELAAESGSPNENKLSSSEIDLQDPDVVLANSKLMASQGEWKQVVELLERYRRLRPSDLRGMELLSQAYRLKGEDASARKMDAKFRKQFDNQTRLINSLEEGTIQLKLAEDLLDNVRFRYLRGQPFGWEWLVWPDYSYQQARFFLGGMDPTEVLNGAKSLRIQGVWTRDVPGNIHFPRAAYRTLVRIPPQSVNFLTLSYRTDRAGQQKAAIVLTDKRDNRSAFYELRVTDGSWTRTGFLLINPESEAAESYILLLNHGDGTVWFQDVNLSRVLLDGFTIGDWQQLLGALCTGLGLYDISRSARTIRCCE